MLARIEAIAEMVEPAATTATAPDPGDQMLWDLLAGHADAVLVTSDKLLLRDRWMRGRIVTPDAWLALG